MNASAAPTTTKNYYLLVNEYGNGRNSGSVCVEHNKRKCGNRESQSNFRKDFFKKGQHTLTQYNAGKFINEDILLLWLTNESKC